MQHNSFQVCLCALSHGFCFFYMYFSCNKHFYLFHNLGLFVEFLLQRRQELSPSSSFSLPELLFSFKIYWNLFSFTTFKAAVFFLRHSLLTQMVRNLPVTQETPVLSLGQEDPLEKEMTNHSSTLAWRIPHISFSVQISSVARSCLTLCDPMDCSTPGLPVHH